MSSPAGTPPAELVQAARRRIERWVRPELRRAEAYAVPDAAGLVKLDAMENPYDLPVDLRRAWIDALATAALNRYPDAQARDLKSVMREALGVPAGMDMLIGNGSDELIQMIALALSGPRAIILAPEPSFVMYRTVAEWTGCRYRGVPLATGDFSLDAEQMLAMLRVHEPAVVFLALPNNPTGNLFDRETIRAIIRAAPGLVVMDEAYHPYAGVSLLDELGRHDNLLVLRTLSKLGLAGLRIGVLIGQPLWLEQIDKTRLPYNIGVLNQISAAFLMRHFAVLAEQAARIRAAREALYAAMRALAGIEVWPSAANFLLFRVTPDRTDALHAALKRAGVLIKNLHGSHPLLAGCLRVTVGLPEENAKFLEALATALAE
jgi:histidinol-phosphate aminotransferase